eukprot:TRINITY_DN55868_c0_g1_i1.p1 TRINITY_DN55868_c0_g1~~TRINITY_DN55868_c0_g1_i1.p1  ORF type:complete len:523 (-),score=62.42 TRINITY_DN55868_c0_g1_i1:168-1736(-)
MSRSGPVWGRGVQVRAAGRPPPEYYWDGDHWSYTGGQHGDGREKAASEFARSAVAAGDAEAFIAAIDRFHARGRNCELIHVGPKKGGWLDAATKLRKPKVALEFGTQIGYSAIRIGRLLPPGGHLWTIEPNPENASLAGANLAHAGLASRVTVLRGKLEDVWKQIPSPVDFVFLDHSRAAYLKELKGLEHWGYVVPGTLVVTDNIGGEAGSHGYAKAEEYAAYVREGGRFTSTFHFGDDDGIEVSECIGTGKPQFMTKEWHAACEKQPVARGTAANSAPAASKPASVTSISGTRRWARGQGNPSPSCDLSPPDAPTPPEQLPKLVVFDLDGVCWNPEMYQLKGGPPYSMVHREGRRSEVVAGSKGGAARGEQQSNGTSDAIATSAGEVITLHEAVKRVWMLLAERQEKGMLQVAIASSSRREKALPLLKFVRISPRLSMHDVVRPELLKMFYARQQGKRPHLVELLATTGIDPKHVLFLDDNRDNVASVHDLGITAVLTKGLSEANWQNALKLYSKKLAQSP